MPPLSIARWRWGVVWLLFAATLLNYTDRQLLAATQRYVLAEFEPDPARRTQVYGDLAFYFGLAFGLTQLLAGFLADRFSLRYLYAGAILLWSAAGAATGLVTAFPALIACRVALGVGEAFNWPCAVAGVRRVIPRESRGLANGLFHGGASIGALITPVLVLAFVDTSAGPAEGAGWQTVFVVVGAGGLVWAAVWLLATGGDRAAVIDTPTAEPDGRPGPTLGRVLAGPLFWICLVSATGVNVCWHFYTIWFPRYLDVDLRVDGRTVQYILAGFFVAADAGSLTAGWLARRLARGGWPVERARQVVMTALALVVLAATAVAVALPADPLAAKMAAFFVVAAAALGGFSVVFALVQDVAPRHTAQVLGICGCGSWLVISALNKVAGGYARPGHYAELFLAVGCVPLAAAAAGWCWPTSTRHE